MSAKQIGIYSDSQLIVNQVTADFAAKEASMLAYLSTTNQLLQKFQANEVRQIPRTENSNADTLARLASGINYKIGRRVPVEILSRPSMATSEVRSVCYSTNQHSSYIEVGNLRSDDHWIVMGVKDPLFFHFGECDGFPQNLRQFVMPANLYAEDLWELRGSNILLPRSVGYTRQSGASADGADHINLSICI
ncbi:hypothetical protein L3X38_017092 [Prunus dulcis]|uniref:RNase H type-1 domain-containing protein n=1 Tax=Prunus dulcis TaxID=3755 RepID=A0AAD4Z9Q6_PRUDU|nr:hypothetical protein L3X38_017092 [Prunus dulcis]